MTLNEKRMFPINNFPSNRVTLTFFLVPHPEEEGNFMAFPNRQLCTDNGFLHKCVSTKGSTRLRAYKKTRQLSGDQESEVIEKFDTKFKGSGRKMIYEIELNSVTQIGNL